MRRVCLSLLLALWAGCGDDSPTEGPCQGVDCSLSGTCTVVSGKASCDCDPGYIAQGLTCQPDLCLDRVCQHGACTVEGGMAICRCEPPWEGDDCSLCGEGTHIENGTCLPDGPCDTIICAHGVCVGEGECECDTGYDGDLCDQCAPGYHAVGLICEADAAGPCSPNPCAEEHRTICVDDGQGDFECRCDGGYHDDNGACVMDTVCDNETTCSGHGACTGAGLECACHTGYQGDHCESCAPGYHQVGLDCQADDPCSPNPCADDHRSVCIDDGQGGFECLCDAGYHPVGLDCEADDPCSPNPCADDHRSVCIDDGQGGFECRCDAGYHDDNGACVMDTVCDDGTTCSGHGACTGIGLECLCDTGYEGDHCESCAPGYHQVGLDCEADDPCSPNPCADDHRSVCIDDGQGGFECLCDAGYHDDNGACVVDTVCDDETTCSGHGTCTGIGLGCLCDTAYQGETCNDCAVGHHWEGEVCVPDSGDACHPNPCIEDHRTLCTPDGAAGYSCGCDEGYEEAPGACTPRCDVDADLCAAANPSAPMLVSSNGHCAVGYDIGENKGASLLEHLYRNWDENIWTRDILYDTYLGLRAGSSHQWLNEVTPVRVGYLGETGIIHVVHRVGTLRVDTYMYAPWELSLPALVLIGKVTNEGAASAEASLYTLHNYHLGNATQDPANPDAQTEQISYLSESGSYVETGVGGMLLYRPLDPATHHGCSPDNPWQALNAGQDLADTASSGPAGTDKVAGFQRDFSLGAGESGWFGVVAAFDRYSSQDTLTQYVGQVYGNLSSQAALAAALAEWEAWRQPAPQGLSPAELSVWRQSEAILRQGQVREDTDLSFGQIVASLPPGNWNICWMRDMAYAIVALAKTGHFEEARAALEFVLVADSGYYESYAGVPYQVTITRYFGRGKEETDFNEDGPNIEFDGFGLFLWALAEYVEESGDSTLLDDHWAIVRDLIAGALVDLQDEATGLIQADSSIWEVHWNGKQKRYAYTSLAAARGLCGAAGLAAARGEAGLAAEWEGAALSIRDALASHCVDGNHVLASSYEELQSGHGYYDVASVEAFDWLLFNPAGPVGLATLDSYDSHLRVASGRGFFRNDDGGWYDSQEWVYADLRTSIASRRAGRDEAADRLLDWITAQALANHGMIAELHEPLSSAYEGEIPMVGYGGGAYILALLERLSPEAVAPVCGGWE